MSTVDRSPRDANGNIIGPNKISIIGGGSFVGSTVGALMAMAGSALPILTETERLYPPKVYPENERHQGQKEKSRRVRQIAKQGGRG